MGPTVGNEDGFSPFPLDKLWLLSDSPSVLTNKAATMILNKLGVCQAKIDAMQVRTVKGTVQLALRYQGLHSTEYKATYGHFGPPPGIAFVESCAMQILCTLRSELRLWKGDTEQFCNTRPMAHEVLEFLEHNSLNSYALVFASHDIDTLAMVAALQSKHVATLNREHNEMYPLWSKLCSVGAQIDLQMAVDSLKGDSLTKSLRERLNEYRDNSSSSMATITAGNAIEIIYSKAGLRVLIFCFGACLVNLSMSPLVQRVFVYMAKGCIGINSCERNLMYFMFYNADDISILCAALAVMLPLLQPTSFKAYKS